MTETTARLALPMIVPGQAQKDMTHNEALAMLDLIAHPCVEAIGTAEPPSSPALGDCWIVGASPTGAWTGHAGAIAGWTAGGWRFVTPRNGVVVRIGTSERRAAFFGGTWHVDAVTAPIADPAGGNVIDVQARSSIGQILTALRGLRLIPDGM